MYSIDECIQPTSVDCLDIITSGEQPPNPAELLGSSQMKVILDELSEKYNYIIVNMPSVNIVSDPLSIGIHIAGLVVVVKYAQTTFDDIATVIKKAELSNSRICPDES